MNQTVRHSEPASVLANGITIVYDTFGEDAAPPMLLIMGLGAQMIAWDDGFCVQLAGRGYRVIRYDNRDAGLSTKFDSAGVPDVSALVQSMMSGQAIDPPYTLGDMASDAVGVLDALDIPSAHIVGASMGGMIAQEVAITFPERVRTLTSIMSTTSDPALPPPTSEALALLLQPAPTDREGYLDSVVKAARTLNGPGFAIDEERFREREGRAFDRGPYPGGTARQIAAILASGSRREALRSVVAPTLVIHGDADPLVPVEGGIDTANSIPGAKLLIVEGLGHTLPPQIWSQAADAIAEHAV